MLSERRESRGEQAMEGVDAGREERWGCPRERRVLGGQEGLFSFRKSGLSLGSARI